MAVDLVQVVRDLRDQLDHYKARVDEQNSLLRREAAIEKVRSEALMMESSDDLTRVVAVMWRQMQEMGITALVSIEFVDNLNACVHTYLALENPKLNGREWTSPDVIELDKHTVVARWRKDLMDWSRKKSWQEGSVWSFERDQADTRKALEGFVRKFGFGWEALPSMDRSYFTTVPFEHGTVRVSGAKGHLPEDQVEFVQELTNALSLGFIRFLDLQQIRERTDQLAVEQEKSEALLLNILPESIAERLKQSTEVIADSFPEVSVLFADLVGFTRISSSTSPEMLVSLLNEVFSAFDRLAEKHQVEKIKTIGDSYMVVAGLPEPCENSACAIAEMALDMLREIRRFKPDVAASFHLRIGINTGPVIAGVIGTKKFSYDLWGDTVNTASRMESHGIVDEIQVSELTYNLVKDNFELEKRGAIEIKNKGEMVTYLLKGRRVED
jgi:class 3 adenylate cyclase